jgi:predicted small lipoprotein YifL
MLSISRTLAIALLAATMVGCGLSQDLVFEVPPAPDYTELDNWAGHAEKLETKTDTNEAKITLKTA